MLLCGRFGRVNSNAVKVSGENTSNWIDYNLDVLAGSPAEMNQISERLNQRRHTKTYRLEHGGSCTVCGELEGADFNATPKIRARTGSLIESPPP